MLLSFILSLVIAICYAVPIDNGIVGLPQVNCEENRVSMIFNTQKPFTGRIFVKGMSDKNSCSNSYSTNTGTSVIFELGNGGCNMRRQRRLGPQRGIEQSMTVVISFHDIFITKVDRAYRCTCFFMEADKVVTSQFEVSMLPTTSLIDTARMPLCTYSVRKGSISGDVVTYARVGDEVYHVWQCDSDMFGMLVHSCFVDDGQGQNRFQLLDEKGCAVDPVILGELTYNNQVNMAFVEAHVFKFADKVSTYFQCAVSLCMKNDGACNGISPPRCNRRLRFQRDAETIVEKVPEHKTLLSRDSDLDLSAERIIVLDLDDKGQDSEAEDSLNTRAILSHNPYLNNLDFSSNQPQVCLSSYGFGVLVVAFLFILTIAIAVIGLICVRQRSLLSGKE